MSPTQTDLAVLAARVANTHVYGRRAVCAVGAVQFDLVTGGWCARFVRQVWEAAVGADFPYLARNARGVEALLRKAGKAVSEPRAGDIVFFNDVSLALNYHGHVGWHLDEHHFAENTSSLRRGPGTVISHYDNGLLGRVSGYYRLLKEGPAVREVKVCRPSPQEGQPTLISTVWLPETVVGIVDGGRGDRIRDPNAKLYVEESDHASRPAAPH